MYPCGNGRLHNITKNDFTMWLRFDIVLFSVGVLWSCLIWIYFIGSCIIYSEHYYYFTRWHYNPFFVSCTYVYMFMFVMYCCLHVHLSFRTYIYSIQYCAICTFFITKSVNALTLFYNCCGVLKCTTHFVYGQLNSYFYIHWIVDFKYILYIYVWVHAVICHVYPL